MGKPELIDDERFQDRFSRLTNQNELDIIITEWTIGQTLTDVLNELLADVDIQQQS